MNKRNIAFLIKKKMILLVKNANILKIIQRHGSSFSYKNLPNESKQLIDKIIRVDHAGEFGANQIYKGQLAVLGKTNVGPVIQVNLCYIFNNIINHNRFKEMWDQEKAHLKEFERLMPKYRARPTLLLPLWEIAGFALGNIFLYIKFLFS